METFSLIQYSLDQSITRQALEEASTTVKAIARTDCARMSNDLFGIVISRLSKADALTFQAALKKHDFPTHLVSDRKLPLLHESFQIQRIARKDTIIELSDSIGRMYPRPVSDLVFLAGGIVQTVAFKSKTHQHMDFRGGEGKGGGMGGLVTEREHYEEKQTVFRLDFFFWNAPNRLHTVLTEDTVIFHHGNPLRPRDKAGLCGLMFAMADILPSQRLNQGLRDPQAGLIYPSMQSYEEEIRWHFHRLDPKNQGGA